MCLKRRISLTATCPRCDATVESLLHLLRDCNESQVLWKVWLQGRRLDHFNSLNLIDWFRSNLSNSSFRVSNGLIWSDLFCFVCWFVWKWRNRIIFEPDFVWPSHATDIICSKLQEFIHFRKKPGLVATKQMKLIAWAAPPPGFCKLNVDASAQTNPGELALGGIARDSNGRWIFGFTRKLGWSNIIKAELFAIFFGLQCAWKRDIRRIIVESDSLLAVNKVNGCLKPNDHWYQVIKACKDLMNRSWHCQVVHVYREANTCTDHLANSAFNGSFDLHQLDSPPGHLHRLIQEDLLGVARPRAVSVSS